MNKADSSDSETNASKKARFEMLVNKNMKRAYFTALGFVGSHDAALDLSQEAFIRAYRNFSKFDASRNFFTWYYKILRNLCLNFLRDNKKQRENNFIEIDRDKLLSANISDEFENDELINILEDAVTRLEFEDREIIVLREFENYSYKEISEMLNIPVGTVMSRLFHARKKLAEELRKKI